MQFFAPLTIILASVAFLMGRGPERAVALTFIAWVVVDGLYHVFAGPMSYRGVDLPHAVLDAAVFLALFYVMLKANRNWPLVAVAVQMIALAGHLSAWVMPNGMQRAYWAMTQFPMVIALMSLLIGSALQWRRQTHIGPYRSWSY